MNAEKAQASTGTPMSNAPFAPVMPAPAPPPAEAAPSKLDEPQSDKIQVPQPVRDCIAAMEAQLVESPPIDVDIAELYASRSGSWLRRIHEVLYAWSLTPELPPGYCTYRYKGMKTALVKKCEKAIKPDAVTKILKILADARVIHRPEAGTMKRMPRLGHGYPIKVLIAPPGAQATQRRVLAQILTEVDGRVAVPVIQDYLESLCLNVEGPETILRQYCDRIESL